jgi:CheY-specific phosphatase CheX
MNDFYKDILTGLVFIIGLLGFISGEFIVSSVLFASAAVASNVNVTRKRDTTGQLSCE